MRLQDIPTQKTEPGIAVAQECGEISYQLDQLDKYLYRLRDEISELEAVLLTVLRDSYPKPEAVTGEDNDDVQSAMGARLYGMATMVRTQAEGVQELRGRVML